jgi:hypothetical protein
MLLSLCIDRIRLCFVRLRLALHRVSLKSSYLAYRILAYARRVLGNPYVYSLGLGSCFVALEYFAWTSIFKNLSFYQRQTNEESRLLIQSLLPLLHGSRRATDILISRISTPFQNVPMSQMFGMGMMVTPVIFIKQTRDDCIQLSERSATYMNGVISCYMKNKVEYLTKEWLREKLQSADCTTLVLSYLNTQFFQFHSCT